MIHDLFKKRLLKVYYLSDTLCCDYLYEYDKV